MARPVTPFEVLTTEVFDAWLEEVSDDRAVAAILRRIERAQEGNLGRVDPVGHGVSELKIDHGPGYRLYFVKSGRTIILLLCGGDKSTQTADIRQAHKLAKEMRR